MTTTRPNCEGSETGMVGAAASPYASNTGSMTDGVGAVAVAARLADRLPAAVLRVAGACVAVLRVAFARVTRAPPRSVVRAAAGLADCPLVVCRVGCASVDCSPAAVVVDLALAAVFCSLRLDARCVVAIVSS